MLLDPETSQNPAGFCDLANDLHRLGTSISEERNFKSVFEYKIDLVGKTGQEDHASVACGHQTPRLDMCAIRVHCYTTDDCIVMSFQGFYGIVDLCDHIDCSIAFGADVFRGRQKIIYASSTTSDCDNYTCRRKNVQYFSQK